MRRRTRILGSVTIIAVALFVGWLALPSKFPVPAVSLLIITNTPNAYHSFFTAFLTNSTASSIGLDPLLVQLEDQEGRILNNLGESWAQEDGMIVFALPPKGVAVVSPQADPNHSRIRLIAEYSCDGTAFQVFVGHGISRLPLRLLPRNLRGWLANHGFLDGRLHGRIESSWMLNPSFQRTPDRPSVSNSDASDPASLNSGRWRQRTP